MGCYVFLSVTMTTAWVLRTFSMEEYDDWLGRVCTVCGCFERWQCLTDECCWNEIQMHCVFPPLEDHTKGKADQASATSSTSEGFDSDASSTSMASESSSTTLAMGKLVEKQHDEKQAANGQ